MSFVFDPRAGRAWKELEINLRKGEHHEKTYF